MENWHSRGTRERDHIHTSEPQLAQMNACEHMPLSAHRAHSTSNHPPTAPLKYKIIVYNH